MVGIPVILYCLGTWGYQLVVMYLVAFVTILLVHRGIGVGSHLYESDKQELHIQIILKRSLKGSWGKAMV